MADPIVDAATALSAAIDDELKAAATLSGLTSQVQTANADVVLKTQLIDKANKALSDAIVAKKATKPVPTPTPVPIPVVAPVEHVKG